MLYRSAYTADAVFGDKSQELAGVYQLVPNQKGARRSAIVGMSMAPSIWIVNFALIYTLNPSLAANMPARRMPIPANASLAAASSYSPARFRTASTRCHFRADCARHRGGTALCWPTALSQLQLIPRFTRR